MVGPSMVALRPPAHSTWATFLPPRSAACAMVSACRTPESKAEVRLVNAWPLMWNVLLVDPWTPAHAPVAREYHPAPVLGGASGIRPPPVADVPFFNSSAIVGSSPWPAYCSIRSCRMPSATKKTALPDAFGTGDPDGGESALAATPGRASIATTASREIVRRPLAMGHLRVTTRPPQGTVIVAVMYASARVPTRGICTPTGPPAVAAAGARNTAATRRFCHEGD